MRKNNLAYICSPYRGNILEKVHNILYAKHLTKLALQLGYTPITTHLYLTQVLNDNNPTERRQGLKAGGNILNACDTIIIGARYGVSAGMAAEMDAAKEGTNCNPYTGADCKEGITQYFKEEGEL